VTGNGGPPYGVDITDPCLDVSVGTPVRWVKRPTGYLTGPAAVCVDDTIRIVLTLAGGGPFNVTIGQGVDSDSLFNIQSGHLIEFVANQTVSVALLSILDNATPGCEMQVDTSITITVHQENFIQKSASICAGDSILIGGEIISTAGMYTHQFTNRYGCDSIEQTIVLVHPTSATDINKTSCDSSQVGVFETMLLNSNGCDSIVTMIVSYALSDTTYLSGTTCDSNLAGTFTTTLQSGAGCDSVIIESVALNPASMTQFVSQTCDSSEAGLYSDTLINVFGCDSIVFEEVVLMSSWVVDVISQTCDPLAAGTYVTHLFTSAGCDSIITETVTLLPSDTTLVSAVTCEDSETGVASMQYANSDGCDSVVILTTTLDLPEICDPVVVKKSVFIPNVFSPNGDGINDVFTVYANPAIVTNVGLLQVFDRWGALIGEWHDFVPGDLSRGWNGSYNEKLLDPAVFVWVCHVDYYDGTSEVLYGDVSLVR
jgi:gliding motility-associated-like protein